MPNETKARAMAGEPSPGQLAYEQDVAREPNYNDGSPRRSWNDLDDLRRWSWERNPTVRARAIVAAAKGE